MGFLDVNGSGAIDAVISLPRAGAWHADLRVDSLDPITSPVTISIGDGQLVFTGSVWRGDEFADTAFVRVVAGADGLRGLATPKHYGPTSVRIVLLDLLGNAGEQLAASADQATLAKTLPAWTTAALPVGRLITRLMAIGAPGATWRALPDGTIWVGPETWPDSGLQPDDYQIIDEEPRRAEAFLGVEFPLLLPGTMLGDRRTSYVEHHLTGDGTRTVVWFEDDPAPAADRLEDAFAAIVRGSIPAIDYFANYWARVISQSGTTIDVEVENPTIKKAFPSMSKVPLTKGWPGGSLQMPAGGRVLIGWSGGDPSRPYAQSFDSGTSATSVEITASQSVSLDAQSIAVGAGGAAALLSTPVMTYLGTLVAAINALGGAATAPTAALLSTKVTIA